MDITRTISDLIDSAELSTAYEEEFLAGYQAGLVDLLHIIKAYELMGVNNDTVKLKNKWRRIRES